MLRRNQTCKQLKRVQGFFYLVPQLVFFIPKETQKYEPKIKNDPVNLQFKVWEGITRTNGLQSKVLELDHWDPEQQMVGVSSSWCRWWVTLSPSTSEFNLSVSIKFGLQRDMRVSISQRLEDAHKVTGLSTDCLISWSCAIDMNTPTKYSKVNCLLVLIWGLLIKNSPSLCQVLKLWVTRPPLRKSTQYERVIIDSWFWSS